MTKLARLLEPRAPRPDLRLDAVRKLSEAGLHVGVNPNPVMPLITDSERQLDRLAKAARDAGARSLRRRTALPHALRAEGLLPVSRRAFP